MWKHPNRVMTQERGTVGLQKGRVHMHDVVLRNFRCMHEQRCKITLRTVPLRGSMTRRALSLQTVQMALPSLFQLTL